jgi:hypothetical protein
MKTLWYKFWCKILGSLVLIRLGVVLQKEVFSKYYIGYSTKKHEFKLRPMSEYDRPKKMKTEKKTKKNPIGFETTGIKD